MRVINSRWILTDFYPSATDVLQGLVLHETAIMKCCWEAEHSTVQEVSIEAWENLAETQKLAKWQTTVVADETTIWDSYYVAVLQGCCAASSLSSFISLNSGRVIFQSSDWWIDTKRILPVLEVPNSSLRRYIAFHDMHTEDDPPEAMSDESFVGVLQYGGSQGPVQRVVLRLLGTRGIDYRLKHIAFEAADGGMLERGLLWSADRKTDPVHLGGFKVVVQLGCLCDNPDAVIEVPVAGNKLIINNAVLPAGFVLQMPAGGQPL